MDPMQHGRVAEARDRLDTANFSHDRALKDSERMRRVVARKERIPHVLGDVDGTSTSKGVESDDQTCSPLCAIVEETMNGCHPSCVSDATRRKLCARSGAVNVKRLELAFICVLSFLLGCMAPSVVDTIRMARVTFPSRSTARQP
tara:strand:+ start:515 stop:949 length:435 start_codon:yes stop_codon:yes gene_type:complete